MDSPQRQSGTVTGSGSAVLFAREQLIMPEPAVRPRLAYRSSNVPRSVELASGDRAEFLRLAHQGS